MSRQAMIDLPPYVVDAGGVAPKARPLMHFRRQSVGY
jgi:hypothetical protein